MPLVRINIIKGKSKEFKKTLLNSVHEGLIEAFGIEDWDRFQRIAEIDKDDFELPEGKTENFMIIELTVFPGRTSEQKRDAIEKITRKISDRLSILPADIFIIFNEPPLENWGLGGKQKNSGKLYLVKPDLTFFEQYNDMMREWCASGTQIAPWFLNAPFETLEEFEKFIKMLDICEHADKASPYASTTSYFVINEDGRLIGATSLRHYLTVEGFNSWGHIGYGIRPSERRKGYAVQSLKLMLEQAKAKHIYKVLIGVHEGNVGSRKTVEKCGGIFENTVFVEGDKEPIRRYWIKVQ
jgi:4-oxalocrotonate tautomerase family enzyme